LYFTGTSLRNLLTQSGFKIVSHNPDSSDNLNVVAQYSPSHIAPHPKEANHPLVSAQNARRWMPYLMQQLRGGQPMRKWRVRKEEKRTAAQYPNGHALLKDLYEKN
jgi:hypothetical protein